jgi:hypothetical protein
MEDRVNVPGREEVELGCHWGYEFRNGKGAVTFRGQFDHSMGNGEVLPF